MSKNKKLNNSGTIFFAYQSKDKSKDSNNIDAIKAFKKTYGDRAITWESMKSNGKLINRQILSSIDAAETFACDMSYLNYNVLFELGYAIGKKKPLLILLNSSINDALKNYTSIPVLKGLGYSLFNNAEDILKAITSIDKSSVLIQQLDRLVENEKNTHEIFYIKSSCNTQADLSALDYIKETYNNSIIDEPDEIAYQTLEWYLSSINKCQMMIVHLVSQSNINANTYNSRNSFFAGIGLALGKKVLLVSPITNSIPIDYDEICVQYNDSEDCVNNIDNWIKRRKKKLSPISPKINKFDHETSLLMLGIGYSVAEHEKDQLMHYFVPTYAFNEAKKRNSLIFYGRKGTGKTAIYYKLLDEFDDQDTVLTIQLKPESSDLIENIRASKIFKDSITRSTIFNTIWKLILSSQLLTILYEMTIKKKREINLPEEDDLIK
ncbi:MAG: hypothetical protein Q8876_09650, partial [Bacillota bacterium]|nr:hypothetical protein [Bacillota bacterium]